MPDRLTPEERAVIEAAMPFDGDGLWQMKHMDAMRAAVRAYRESQQKWRAAGEDGHAINGPDGRCIYVYCADYRDRVLALLNAGEDALTKEEK